MTSPNLSRPILGESGELLEAGEFLVQVGTFAVDGDHSALSDEDLLAAEFVPFGDAVEVGEKGVYWADVVQEIPTGSLLIGKPIYTLILDRLPLSQARLGAIFRHQEIFASDYPGYLVAAHSTDGHGVELVLGGTAHAGLLGGVYGGGALPGISVQPVSVSTTPMDAWADQVIGPGADPEMRGPLADPNSDGRPNFYHFALNLDPMAQAGRGDDGISILSRGSDVGTDGYSVAFPVRKGALFTGAPPRAEVDGVCYTVLASGSLEFADLLEVEELDLGVEASLPPLDDLDGDGEADWEYRRFGIASRPAQAFLRLQVELK